MPTNVIMPQLGESVVEGTVSRWLKQEGETVTAFEPLLEISTDKVDSEIPAPADGVVLQILIQEGETVERGTVLAVIGQANESVGGHGNAPSRQTEPVGARHASPVQSTPSNGNNGHANGTSEYSGHVTPVVARMAAEHHLDLAQIKGTGREGRITKKDVEAYLAQPSSAVAQAEAEPETQPEPWETPGSGDLFKPTVDYSVEAKTESVGARHASPTLQTPTPQPPRVHPVEPIPDATDGELVKLSPMRKAIAEHMVRSKLQTSPHVTTIFEIDLSAVLAHREANKAAFAKQGVNLTLTAYFVTASVEALRAVPYLNAQWTDEGIFLHTAINIGVAVAIEDGLIVPVIQRAQDLNLLGTARAVNDLANRARNKQLKPDEVQGGTFTITNHGVSGSLFATPIINQPQVGILGVGVLEKRVKVISDALGNDTIAIRPCLYASLTFDHRVVDGAAGDSFMTTLKNRLEGWR
ncbi:MAG TPA: dihydrolipoamide acetyltransferase family protein [Phototrophicaceae bacterium]|nr:dihydrolipoamide acetyltransferase family protein [Phototrophicaceae bacterium]